MQRTDMEAETTQELEQLAKKVQQGDRDAFGRIFMLLSDAIYRYALLKIGNEQDAKDIVSETFKRVWSYIHAYRQDNFRAYVYRIAHNLICDYQKRKNRLRPLSPDVDIETPDDTVDRIISREETHELHDALARLPAHYYAIVNLRFIEGYSVKETARIVGKSEIVVRVTQSRALAKLKKMLS